MKFRILEASKAPNLFQGVHLRPYPVRTSTLRPYPVTDAAYLW
jgi:hypothetical protein